MAKNSEQLLAYIREGRTMTQAEIDADAQHHAQTIDGGERRHAVDRHGHHAVPLVDGGEDGQDGGVGCRCTAVV